MNSGLRFLRAVLFASLVLLLGHAAWLGVDARLPVGSDHGAYRGLDRLAATVAAGPHDAILYHHSLGWPLDFYLFDTGQEPRWWDSPHKLAADAAATAQTDPGRVLWLALTGTEDMAAGEIRAALAEQGLSLVEAQRFYRSDGSCAFVLYRIVADNRAGRGATLDKNVLHVPGIFESAWHVVGRNEFRLTVFMAGRARWELRPREVALSQVAAAN